MYSKVYIVMLASLILGTFSKPQNSPATILKEVNKPDIDKFDFEFDTSDGVHREEQGKLQDDIWTVRGVYSFQGTDGKPYTTQYIADENGFRKIPTASDLSKSRSYSAGQSRGVVAAPIGK